MWCSFPPPLTDDQLTDALDGDADADVQQHLTGCAHCSARLAQAQRAEHSLHTSLHRFGCPTSQQLGDYQLNLAAKADARVIAQHVQSCVRCTGELEELRAYLADGQAPRAPAQAPLGRSALGKLFGQLLPRATASAMRGAGSEPIIAEAGDTTIILDVQPAGTGQVTIQGQLLSENLDLWTSSLVELRQAGVLQATATLNDLGAFNLGALPIAVSELRLTPQRGQMIILPEIHLAA